MENMELKKSMFDKLKLPLLLKLGRVGKLQILVPWRSLSSSPVEVIIDSVYMIICNRSI